MPTQARRTMSRRALENIVGLMRAKNEPSGMRLGYYTVDEIG
jgi:hypothetical protein